VLELQTKATERTKVTIASLVQESEEVRALAVMEKQLSAANAAIVNQAKLSGLWLERSEVSDSGIEFMSIEELEDYVRHRND
jgi:hypothetical protein